MADILKFDNSIEYKLKRAHDYYDEELLDVSLPLLYEVLKEDEKNEDALLLLGKIYADMNAIPESMESYMTLLSYKKNTDAVKGIISNLLLQGNFKDARYYAETYKVDFDFSNFLTVQTEDGETLFGDDDEDDDVQRNFKLVVNRREKGGENLAKEKPINELTVNDLTGFMTEDGMFKFNDLMEKLLTMSDTEEEIEEDDEHHSKRRSEIGFKQVYPIPKKECENIVNDAFTTFTNGHPEEALEKLQKITKSCGKYYYIAEKNKVLCYLSMNRMASMRASAEIALKGLPDDYTLKCYYYISLKLLEENKEADIVYQQLKDKKPQNSMEYMVKLDACRLQLDHEGLIDCLEHILVDFPYQQQLLMLYAKAQYNAGYIDKARASFLDLLKLFPSNFEAKLMLDKINSKDDGEMSYSEIELQIKRVKVAGEIKILLQNSAEFYKYLLYNKDAIRNLEFVLLNESDRTVYTIVTMLKHYMSGDVLRMLRRLLISQKSSLYLKTLIITTLLSGNYPKVVSVAVGSRLKIVDIPDYSWDKGLTDVFVQAADIVMAQFIMGENNPKKQLLALTNRLKRVSEYIMKEDNDVTREIQNMTDAVALKRALNDITIHKVQKKTPMTLADENYIRYIDILERIDEDYEI